MQNSWVWLPLHIHTIAYSPQESVKQEVTSSEKAEVSLVVNTRTRLMTTMKQCTIKPLNFHWTEHLAPRKRGNVHQMNAWTNTLRLCSWCWGAKTTRNKEKVHVCILQGGVSVDGKTSGGMWGGVRGVMMIREKFRPVKVSLLPIVLLIKAAPAPVLIEGLSLSCSPSLFLSLSLLLFLSPSSSFSWQLVCEGRGGKAYRAHIASAVIKRQPHSN